MAMHREVHNFAVNVVRPAGIELDMLHDPADVYKDGSPLWDVFKAQRELDLHMMRMPKAFGGLAENLDPMAGYLIGEEMGYGDAGLAISLGAAGMPFSFAAMFPHIPELKQMAHDYCEDREGKMIGCWAITEPDHGGDFGDRRVKGG